MLPRLATNGCVARMALDSQILLPPPSRVLDATMLGFKVLFISFNFVVLRSEPRAPACLGIPSSIELYPLLPLLTLCPCVFTRWSENGRSGLQVCESDPLLVPGLSS